MVLITSMANELEVTLRRRNTTHRLKFKLHTTQIEYLKAVACPLNTGSDSRRRKGPELEVKAIEEHHDGPLMAGHQLVKLLSPSC